MVLGKKLSMYILNGLILMEQLTDKQQDADAMYGRHIQKRSLNGLLETSGISTDHSVRLHWM